MLSTIYNPIFKCLLIIFLIFLMACKEENIKPENPAEDPPDYIRFDHTAKVIYDGGGMNIPDYVDVGDFNNDGNLDVVLHKDNLGEIIWLLNDGEGNFSDPISLPKSYLALTDIATIDFDNDNYDDIVAIVDNSSGNSTVYLWKNESGNGFQNPTSIGSVSEYAHSITLFDYNQDNKLDITIGVQYDIPLVLLNNGSNSSWTIKSLDEGLNYSDYIAFGDLTSNSKLDLVAIGGNRLKINHTELTFNTGNSHFLSLADIDNDGAVDIIANKSYDKGIAWLQYKNGTLTENIIKSTVGADFIWALEVADFDEDGDNDIIVGYWTNNSSSFFINDGNGSFSPQNFSLSGVENDKCLVSGDINNDGKLDIIVSNAGIHRVYWYQN